MTWVAPCARPWTWETIARASIRGEDLPAPLLVALDERPVLFYNV
jgi:hypothetical protein